MTQAVCEAIHKLHSNEDTSILHTIFIPHHGWVVIYEKWGAGEPPQPMVAMVSAGELKVLWSNSAGEDYSDPFTATCPLCARYDSARPFIRHAIKCHRDDCDDIEHKEKIEEGRGQMPAGLFLAL